MSKATFKSNHGGFLRKNNSFIDMVLGHMAMDIERGLKSTAGMPVDKGQMKAATRSFRSKLGNHRVEINKEYAAAQEAGVINGHRIRHYTTSGTGPHFFEKAISMVMRHKANYIEEAAKALGL